MTYIPEQLIQNRNITETAHLPKLKEDVFSFKKKDVDKFEDALLSCWIDKKYIYKINKKIIEPLSLSRIPYLSFKLLDKLDTKHFYIDTTNYHYYELMRHTFIGVFVNIFTIEDRTAIVFSIVDDNDGNLSLRTYKIIRKHQECGVFTLKKRG